MKLTRALRDFCPGRFKVIIEGNEDEFFLKVAENSESSGENSETLEHCRVIFCQHGPDLEVLEKAAVKLIGGMKP